MTERNSRQNTAESIKTRMLDKIEIGVALASGAAIGSVLYLTKLSGLTESIAWGSGAAAGDYAYGILRPEVPRVYKAVVQKLFSKRHKPPNTLNK